MAVIKWFDGELHETAKAEIHSDALARLVDDVAWAITEAVESAARVADDEAAEIEQDGQFPPAAAGPIHEVEPPADPSRAIAKMLGKLDAEDKATFNWLVRLARGPTPEARVVEAAQLRLNTRWEFGKRLVGEWVCVPAEDFDKLRADVAALPDERRGE